MSLTKKVYLTISGYDIKLSDNLTFYQNDQLKLIFYINEYGIDYENNATTRALMPVNPLNAILFIENPEGVDSVSSAKIEDNAVTFYLDSTHTQYVGVSRMQLRLFDQDGCAITLPHFTFEIRENIYGSGDVRFQNVVMVDHTGTVILTEDNDMLDVGDIFTMGTEVAYPQVAKTIKELPVKHGLDGTEKLIVEDNEATKQAPLTTIVDEIKQNSQEKIREIESELAQTNAQLSRIYNVVDTDVEDITNSINELLKDGDVKIPTGNYKISSTIVVPKNRNIVFSSGTKITVTGDFDVFELNNNVVINGNNSIIDCSIPGNTSSVFVIKGKYNFDIQNGTCSISNFKLIGNQSNVGLKFICEDTTKNGVKDEHIGWVYVNNINLTYFYKAIEMKVRTSTSGNTPWINSNSIYNIGTEMCHNIIYLDGVTNGGVSGNSFKNFHIQTYLEEKIIYATSSSFNTFEFMAWDIFEDREYFYFDSNCNENLIKSNISYQNIIKWKNDLGFRNVYDSVEAIKRSKVIIEGHLGESNFVFSDDNDELTLSRYKGGDWQESFVIFSENGVYFNKTVTKLNLIGSQKTGNKGFTHLPNGFKMVFGYVDIPLNNGQCKTVYVTLPVEIDYTKIVSSSTNIIENVTKTVGTLPGMQGIQVLTSNLVLANYSAVYITLSDLSSKLASNDSAGDTFRVQYQIIHA